MKNQWLVQAGIFFVLAGLVVLPGCTPSDSGWDKLEWVVANHTADTVRVQVRFALDSVRLSEEEQVAFTQEHLVSDTVDAEPRGPLTSPLDRIAWHRNHWYRVFTAGGFVNAYLDGDTRRQAQVVNLPAGVLLYPVPPHGTQRLFMTLTNSSDRRWWQAVPVPPVAPVSGLWLQEGTRHRTVQPGPDLLNLFRPERTGREYDYSARARRTLTVRPGLVFSPWEGLKRTLSE
ncbi:hypothetical protein Q5H92_16755 [Hymenobacter sp. M29]|uniref:Uncharacterized protein n=1 Tax=Hymenobacter mellowenesis TaxID=3063995 RepID=A0ABT9AH57_9BACT|nr:hypothetical protein [Hymenobacter sp. M29]MDO7848017.1 hypothetical protein [Hymenobacter sp. M29]